MGRVGRPSQEPGGDQGLERLHDLSEVIPDVLGQALAEEEGSRMLREEQQQIEITRLPQAPNTVKEIHDAPGWNVHRRGYGYVRRSLLVRITRATTINDFAGLGAGRQFPDAGQPSIASRG